MMNPRDVISQYPITVDSMDPIAHGHIHRTFLCSGSEGKWVLQWVNPIFGVAVMEDISAVTEHLRTKGVTTYDVLRTAAGNTAVPDPAGGFWRVMSYIPGYVSVRIESADMAYEAGKLLGQFHAELTDCTHQFAFSRPKHRQTAQLLSEFRASIHPALNTFDPELRTACERIEELETLLLPDNLPRRITHGDPKISNMIFTNDDARKGIAIVDLDDCASHLSVLVDIGDALRSWCQGEEDNPHATFSLSNYKSAVRGYLEMAGDMLTAEERTLIPQSVKLIALELACRFGRDIVEDSYFGFDEHRFTTRREHNRARTLAQVSFYEDLVRNDTALRAAIA